LAKHLSIWTATNVIWCEHVLALNSLLTSACPKRLRLLNDIGITSFAQAPLFTWPPRKFQQFLDQGGSKHTATAHTMKLVGP
jgi:hypothetical protein